MSTHGTARHGTARHGTARHGTARHGTARHSTAQHGSGARNVEQTSGRSCTHAASSCIEAFHGGKHVGNETGTIIQSCTYCVPCRTVNAGTAVLTRSFCFYLIPSRVYINGNAPWDWVKVEQQGFRLLLLALDGMAPLARVW